MNKLIATITAAVLLTLFSASANAQDENYATPERRALVSISPKYPTKARNRRIEGDVRVCYTIDARGNVSRPYVQTTSHRIFNRSALRAARSLVYEPAAPDAANERAPACSTYRFRLQPQTG